MSNTTTNTHKTKSSIFHRWVKQTFFRPRLSGLPCIYRLYRNYYNHLHCQDYCGITTPSKLTPQKCTLQKSFLWQLLWLTRHTFRPDAFLASPAAQRPRQLCLFKKRREDVGGKKRPCAPLRPLVWFPVYTTYVDSWHVCACCCLRLRRRVEGAGPQLEASGSRVGGARRWFSQPTEWLSDRDRENLSDRGPCGWEEFGKCKKEEEQQQPSPRGFDKAAGEIIVGWARRIRDATNLRGDTSLDGFLLEFANLPILPGS